jgi:hypothetical protein
VCLGTKDNCQARGKDGEAATPRIFRLQLKSLSVNIFNRFLTKANKRSVKMKISKLFQNKEIRKN